MRLIKIPKPTIFLALCLLLSGCHREKEVAITKSQPQQPTLGVYDSAFDRSKWIWIDNKDGRMLLKHSIYTECFVGYKTEPLGYESPGFDLSKDEKVFSGKKYDVFTVTEKGRIHCITYSKQHSNNDHDLTVYTVRARSLYQREAESIIANYEKDLPSGK